MGTISEGNGLTERDELSLMKMMVLQKHTRSICDVIEARDFLPYMVSAKVFNIHEWQNIKDERNKYQRAQDFVTLILQKDVEGFDAFCSALYKMTKYQNLLGTINISLEEERFKYEAQYKRANDAVPCNPPPASQNIAAQPPINPVGPPIPTFILEDRDNDISSTA